MHPALAAVLVVLLLLLVAYAIVCVSVFRFAFLRRKKQGRENKENMLAHVGQYREGVERSLAALQALPYERVEILSHDGLALRARLYTAENAIGTVILFHGYRSCGENDFSGIFPYYMGERRCSILLVDQRAHGDSEGRYITFGIHERRDCVGWATYIANRFGPSHKIVLDGMSMGAATVMMASAEPLPDNVVGVIADCGYSSPLDILRHAGHNMHLPLPLIMPAVLFLCRTVAHFDPRETDAMRAVAGARIPLLLVHGRADDFVPYTMGEALFAVASEPKAMASIEGAGHGLSYLVSPEAVLAALTEFFDTYVGK